MTASASSLPFSLDPLMAEAKRRMRQRRFLIVVVAILVAGGATGSVFALRSRSSEPTTLTFRSPTIVTLTKAQSGASVICKNARMTTKGRVPAAGQPAHGWVSNYSGHAPALLLRHRSDGSLVVHCQ